MESKTITMVPPTTVQDAMHFARLMRFARLSRDITLRELAEKIGVTQSGQTLRERGQRNITMHDAIETLDALGYALVLMPAKQAPING